MFFPFYLKKKNKNSQLFKEVLFKYPLLFEFLYDHHKYMYFVFVFSKSFFLRTTWIRLMYVDVEEKIVQSTPTANHT